MFLPESQQAIVRPVVPPEQEGSEQRKPIERGACETNSPVRINMPTVRDTSMEQALQASDALDEKDYKPSDLLCMTIQRPTAVYTGPSLRTLMTGGLDEGDQVTGIGWVETYSPDRDNKPVQTTVRVLGPRILVTDPATGKLTEAIVSYNAFAPKPENIKDPAYDAAMAKQKKEAEKSRRNKPGSWRE